MNSWQKFLLSLAALGVLASIATAQQTVQTLDPCTYSRGKVSVPIDIASATTTEIIDAVSGEYAYICAINIMTATAQNVALVEDDTNNCASPTAGMAGGVTAAEGWNFSDNGGLTEGDGTGFVAKSAATNRNICLITSGSGQLSGSVVYVTEP